MLDLCKGGNSLVSAGGVTVKQHSLWAAFPSGRCVPSGHPLPLPLTLCGPRPCISPTPSGVLSGHYHSPTPSSSFPPPFNLQPTLRCPNIRTSLSASSLRRRPFGTIWTHLGDSPELSRNNDFSPIDSCRNFSKKATKPRAAPRL
jgi:hypothetical protein